MELVAVVGNGAILLALFGQQWKLNTKISKLYSRVTAIETNVKWLKKKGQDNA